MSSPNYLYVLADSQGYIITFLDLKQVKRFMDAYRMINMIIYRFPLCPGQQENVWIITRVATNTVLYASNDYETAKKINSDFLVAEFVYEDSIDWHRQIVGNLANDISSRLETQKQVYEMEHCAPVDGVADSPPADGAADSPSATPREKNEPTPSCAGGEYTAPSAVPWPPLPSTVLSVENVEYEGFNIMDCIVESIEESSGSDEDSCCNKNLCTNTSDPSDVNLGAIHIQRVDRCESNELNKECEIAAASESTVTEDQLPCAAGESAAPSAAQAEQEVHSLVAVDEDSTVAAAV